MSAPKQSLLLVDSDPRSCRVLEVSLRKAGFAVTTAANGVDALEKALAGRPELIISDTSMPVMDGFELRRRLRESGDLGEVPFIFLTSQRSVEDKIKGLELGVEDYLTKPIYIREILTRVRIALQKSQRLPNDSSRRNDVRTKFAGQLTDMGVVDLIQTLEISRKSGVIHVNGPGGRRATLFFRNGSIIDAELGRLSGEEAIFRLLTWNDGEFEVDFKAIRRKDVVSQSAQALLMEGMRRLDEWSRLVEQLPPLEEVLEVDSDALGRRLGEVPDEANQVLKLFDGRRSLLEVIEDGKLPDLEALTLIARLHTDGFLCVPVTASLADGNDGRAADGWFLGEKSGVFGIARSAVAALRSQGSENGRNQLKRPTLRGFQVVVEPERRDAAPKLNKTTLRGLTSQGTVSPGGEAFAPEPTNGGSFRSGGTGGSLASRDVVRARAATIPLTSKAEGASAGRRALEPSPQSAVEAAFPELAAPRERTGSSTPARTNGGRHEVVEAAMPAPRVAIAPVKRATSEAPLEVDQDSVISELPAAPSGRPTLGELAAEAARPVKAKAPAGQSKGPPQLLTARSAAEPSKTEPGPKIVVSVDEKSSPSTSVTGAAVGRRTQSMVEVALAAAEPVLVPVVDVAAPVMLAGTSDAKPSTAAVPDPVPSKDLAPVANAKAPDAAAKTGPTTPEGRAATIRATGATALPAAPPRTRTAASPEIRRSAALAAESEAGRLSGSTRALSAGVVAGGTSTGDAQRRRGLAAAGVLAGIAVIVLGLVVRDALTSRPRQAAAGTVSSGAAAGIEVDDLAPAATPPVSVEPTPETVVAPPAPTPEPVPVAVAPAPRPVVPAPIAVAPVPHPVVPAPVAVTPALRPVPAPVAVPRTPTPVATPRPPAPVRTAPAPATADPTLSYGALYEQARMAARQGRSDDALALLDRALALSANGEDALLLKAKLLRDRKRAAEALRLIEQFLKARPYSVEGWRQKGLVHFDLGNLGEAKVAMEKALTLAPPGSADAEAIRALLESM